MKAVRLALAALAVTVTAGTAQAAQCKTKQLEGLWVGTAKEDEPSYCLFQFKETGRIAHSSCFDPPVIKPSATGTGQLTVDRKCAVTGAFVAKGKGSDTVDLKFTGTLDPDKGIIRGTLKVKGGPSITYGFARHWR